MRARPSRQRLDREFERELPQTNSVIATLHRYASLSIVALACLFNLWVLRSETTVVLNLNDSALHLAMVRWARYQIDRGSIPLDGWYPFLSLGYPHFHHYQSFPHIVAAYVSLIWDPTSVFYWSLYLLLSLWPISVYVGTRLLGWPAWTAAVAALASPLVVSVTSYGYEHSSYTWQGLGVWSQLWGMWLLPLAWGSSWRALNGRGSNALAALTIALTIACHFLTGYIALLAVGIWFLVAPSVRRAARAVVVGLGGLLISAWVIVPVLADSKWSLNSQYSRGTFWYDSFGAPKILGWLFTGQIYDSGRLPILSVLVGVGIVVCIARFRRDERARAVLAVWTMSLILFFGRPTLGLILKLLPGSDDLYLHRYLMGVHLAGILLAGIGGAWLSAQALRMGRRFLILTLPGFLPRLRAGLVAAVVSVIGIAALSPGWTQVAAYDQSDEGLILSQQVQDETDGADLGALLQRVRILSAGRVYAGSAATWGKSYAIGSVPVYSVLENDDIDAFGYTLRVVSLMADTEVQFNETNPAQYDLFNIRYLVLPEDRRPAVPATLLAVQGRHRLWQVDTSGYLEVADTVGPPIVADRYTIGERTAAFLESPELNRRQFPTIAFAGAPAAVPSLAAGATVEGPAGQVMVESSSPIDGVFKGEVVANRLAVVLLKATYDPRWKITVDGIQRPQEMVAPGLVAVTVAPGPHSIEFRYVPYPDYALLIAVGLATLILLIALPYVAPLVTKLLKRAAGTSTAVA
jgi:hypothetical protein